MADDATLTVTLNKETAEALARLAAEEGETVEALAAAAIGDMIEIAKIDGPERIRPTDAEFEAWVTEQRR
ncbi:MAG: hypothetical protein HXY28_11090 [Hydrogenophilaceae bacterium]|jgi:hypothetical protein|nr:hypothetical protein [Hydrogenophilaceae bacterium]